jgi:hypothetical protein
VLSLFTHCALITALRITCSPKTRCSWLGQKGLAKPKSSLLMAYSWSAPCADTSTDVWQHLLTNLMCLCHLNVTSTSTQALSRPLSAPRSAPRPASPHHTLTRPATASPGRMRTGSSGSCTCNTLFARQTAAAAGLRPGARACGMCAGLSAVHPTCSDCMHFADSWRHNSQFQRSVHECC